MGEEELELASRMVKPIYASAYFYVSPDGIRYTLVFDYLDPGGYYRKVLGDEELRERELETIVGNMQGFLDKEEILVNGERVRAEVVLADIGFRGEPGRVYILFIIDIACRLKRGVNVYENSYEPEEFEYDYSAYWVFPHGVKIYEALLGGSTRVVGRVIVVSGFKGDLSPGYERIRFDLR